MAKPIGRLAMGPSYVSVMVGLMVNNLLPFRLGELTRAQVLKRRAGYSFTTSMGLILVERVLDVLALLVIFGILVFFFPFPSWVRSGGTVIFWFLTAVIGLLFWLGRNPERMNRIIGFVFGRFHGRLSERLQQLSSSFAEGIRFSHTGGAYLKIGVQTVLIWLTYIAAVWCMFPGMRFDQPYGLGVFEAIVLMVFTTFAILIPSAPGYVGTFHEVAKQSLILFRVPRESALALAIVFHGIHYVAITVVGLICFAASHMRLADALRRDTVTMSS